jgi:hypothetical protein
MLSTIIRSLKRAFQSTFLLTILIIASLDLAITEIKPLRYFNTTGFTPLDQNPLVAKLPEFMHSKENPDVLLLGSSLTLIPAVRCDDEMAGIKTRYDVGYKRNYINGYIRAEYLKQRIKSQLGKNLNIRNLGVIASMFSDHCLILEKTLASGKKPQIVICCIAPRDFLDNYRSQVEKTPVYQVLADMSLIKDLIKRGASFSELANYATGVVWHYYQVRTDYRTFSNALSAQALNHPKSLFDGSTANCNASTQTPKAPEAANNQEVEIEVGILSTNNKPDYQAPPNTLGDLSLYKQVYNPVNAKLFETQMKYLNKMLKLCKEHQIKLYLVNMPLTAENKRLLPQSVWNRYHQLVETSAAQSGAIYLNADKVAQYTLKDFEDSCHLNANGGKKFYSTLVEALRDTGNNQQSLATKHSNQL